MWRLNGDEKARTEGLDSQLENLLGEWNALEDNRLDALKLADLPLPLQGDRPAALRPRATVPPWAAVLVAASMAIASFAVWDLRPVGGSLEEAAGLKAVSAERSSRLELQFSVERQLADGVLTEAGTSGASYGADDRLAMRLAVEGAGGWLYLLEVGTDGTPQQLYPQSPEGMKVGPGVHELRDAMGVPMVYQPEQFRERMTYLALVTSEAVSASDMAERLLSVGLDRPADWPRPVLAADSFIVNWRSTH